MTSHDVPLGECEACGHRHYLGFGVYEPCPECSCEQGKDEMTTYQVVRYAADGHGSEPDQLNHAGDGAVAFNGTLDECRKWIAERVHGAPADLEWPGIDSDIEAYHDYPEDHELGYGCGGYAIQHAS